MKKVFGILALILVCFGAMAQNVKEKKPLAKAWEQDKCLEIGLRDNQFAHFNFLGESGWLVGYEQSLLNVKLREQTGRLFLGQNKDFDAVKGYGFGYTWVAYAGMDYHRSYGMFGARLTAKGSWKFLSGAVTFNPHYDSGYKFQGNFQLDGAIDIVPVKGVQGTISYGNIPEFRNNVDLLKVGLKFTSSDRNLWVKPEVCLPNVGNGSDNLRVLVSMGWSWDM